MTDAPILDDQQIAALAWFQSLRDSLCAAFEALEDEGTGPFPPGRFVRTPWGRPDPAGGPGGGGVMGVMKGRVFEKVRVRLDRVRHLRARRRLGRPLSASSAVDTGRGVRRGRGA